MSDVLDRRLHGVAIYNPDLLSRHELVAQFVARRAVLDQILADLARPGFNQHQLIVGHRGMGKTTLLRRIRFAIEDDSELSAVWLPLTFPEEQYNVNRLGDFYANCLDALSDVLEQAGRREEAEQLDAAIDELPRKDEEARAKAALETLETWSERLGRRLVLLVDNFDLIVERFKRNEREQWELRELLSRHKGLLLIAASPVVIGATYSYDAPFYDFFQNRELTGLTLNETRDVLATFAHELDEPAVAALLENEPARIRTLHVLSGGNPRTIVLLFGVLAQGTGGDVRSDLEKLLDHCTPLYKARFEALPPQSQQVVDALAIHWDPISAGELAEKMRAEVNAVSSQLSRLVQQGVVEKVEYDPPTKTGFQIAERFFNIWYLMRASRRVRRRLIWLVQFLRMFYGAEELRRQASVMLGWEAADETESILLRHAELCLAYADALSDRPMQIALGSQAVGTLIRNETLRTQLGTILDLRGDDVELQPIVDGQQWARDFRQAIDRAKPRWKGFDRQEAYEVIGGSFTLSRKEKLALAKKLSSMSETEYFVRLADLRLTGTVWRRLFGTHLVHKIEEGYCRGLLSTIRSVDDLAAAAVALRSPEIRLFRERDKLPLDEVRRIAETADDPHAWLVLGKRLYRDGDKDAVSGAARKVLADEVFVYGHVGAAGLLAVVGCHDEAVRIIRDITSSDYDIEWMLAANVLEVTLLIDDWEVAHKCLASILRDINQTQVLSGQPVATLKSIGAWVRRGHAQDILRIIEQERVQEELRIVTEAIRLIVSKNRHTLRRLAPEVREPVVSLLESWGQLPEPPVPPKEPARPKPRRRPLQR